MGVGSHALGEERGRPDKVGEEDMGLKGLGEHVPPLLGSALSCAVGGTHRTALTRCHRPSLKEPFTRMDATPLPRL